MLRPGELAALRGTMNSSFTSRCDILANVGGEDDLGQVAEDWQPLNSAPVPCRIVPLTGVSERDVADQTTSTAEAAIILPYDTVITPAHRIRIVGGQTYEVAYRHPAQSEDLSLLCDCKLIE